MCRLPVCIILAFTFVASAYAQVTTAAISGFVLDPSGKAIPNAKVTITDPSHSVSRTVTTDITGFYRILDLAPSSYQLTGEAKQFTKHRRRQSNSL